tara:strand:+ start:59 stop:280 length:222 start_codon:yes stop_codon:yes gene_type:complete
MKTTQKIKRPLDLPPPEANALMVMIESEMETMFNSAYGGYDPIADWEFADLYAYKLLAYKRYKDWYMENHGDD